MHWDASPRWSRTSNNSKAKSRQLQAVLFGRRSETQTRNDRSNDLIDPEDDSLEPKRDRGQQPKNPGPQRRDYSHLLAREVFRELPPERCACPRCGQSLLPLSDTEDSEQIEIEVAAYRRVIHRRRYQRTCTCNGTGTLTASAPSQADSQSTVRPLGLGRDPAGQVLQLSAYRTVAGLVAAVRFGPGTGHCHRRLAAAGSSAQAD